ncbi:ubiquitin-specific protease ubp15 [Mycoemilia scoparia]|uniref:Ubiquitin-specific protease ubp15 n=1 Tax=Mycoemilia scoparia TaxID=417184 RepID=A0A9W8DV34_9FUNG|nr:ubiquitin-specific protease ubp15 [Mycoemilia scoparia]
MTSTSETQVLIDQMRELLERQSLNSQPGKGIQTAAVMESIGVLPATTHASMLNGQQHQYTHQHHASHMENTHPIFSQSHIKNYDAQLDQRRTGPGGLNVPHQGLYSIPNLGASIDNGANAHYPVIHMPTPMPTSRGLGGEYVTQQEFTSFQKTTTTMLEQILRTLNQPSGGGAESAVTGLSSSQELHHGQQGRPPVKTTPSAEINGSSGIGRPRASTTPPEPSPTTVELYASKGDVNGDRYAGKQAAMNGSTKANVARISVYDEKAYMNSNIDHWIIDTKAFHWKIEDWSNLPRRIKSTVFECGGHSWCIVIRPSSSFHGGAASLFLECANDKSSTRKWPVLAQFTLAMANVNDPATNISGSAFHCFQPFNCNWGFTRFMSLNDLTSKQTDSTSPIIENGKCLVSAFVRVLKLPSGLSDELSATMRASTMRERRPASSRRSEPFA